ncbi:MAG TPA: site-specific integrase [Chloroflexota bacterium]|nr:site-specific integrase [Chloroflexota bacterium]
MATIEKRSLQDGTTRYRVKVRRLGAAPLTQTFKRKIEAQAWADETETRLRQGAYVATTEDRRRTLATLIEKYVEEYLPQRGVTGEAKQAALLAWWADHYGHVTLDKLRPEMVADGRRKLTARRKRDGEPLSGATVNRHLAALSSVCKWAWKELRWLPSNPVLEVTKAPESTGIVRFLSDDERKALLTACKASRDPNVYPFVLLALATGARYSNLRMLSWADVDLQHWTLRFVEVKNKQPRFVPIVGPAQAALQSHKDRDPTGQGWVFKGFRDAVPADMDKPWRKVRKAAGIEDVRFHDLRHTTASYLTMNGATLAEVAEALGHRTLVMAKRYAHQSGEHVRGTLERMADRFLTESGEGR